MPEGITHKRYAREPMGERAERNTKIVRDPNAELGYRLECLDELIGDKRLAPTLRESVAVYAAELARLVAEAGEVRTRTTTYRVEAGTLRRRLNF